MVMQLVFIKYHKGRYLNSFLTPVMISLTLYVDVRGDNAPTTMNLFIPKKNLSRLDVYEKNASAHLAIPPPY